MYREMLDLQMNLRSYENIASYENKDIPEPNVLAQNNVQFFKENYIKTANS